MAGKHSGEHLPASLVWSYRALLLNRIIRTPCGCTLTQSKRFRNRIRSGAFPSCPPSLTSAEAAAVPAAPCPARLRPTRDTRRPAGHFLLTSGVRGHLARARRGLARSVLSSVLKQSPSSEAALQAGRTPWSSQRGSGHLARRPKAQGAGFVLGVSRRLVPLQVPINQT